MWLVPLPIKQIFGQQLKCKIVEFSFEDEKVINVIVEYSNEDIKFRIKIK